MFSSRFGNDFKTKKSVRKEGFGDIFEVYQNIDECIYAIKRIIIPHEKHIFERALTEVKDYCKKVLTL